MKKGDTLIQQIAYHRNGLTANSFFVVLFKWHDGKSIRNMVASIFEEPGQLSVFDIDQLLKGNIKFGQGGNSWRGDEYETTLRNAIEIYKARPIEERG